MRHSRAPFSRHLKLPPTLVPIDIPTTHSTALSYIDLSREYYRAKGHRVPYRWARHQSVPFTPLARPLADSRVGVVTTSSLWASSEDSPPTTADKESYASPSEPEPPRLFTRDLFWHKTATHTNELSTFVPLAQLKTMAEVGHIGSVSPRFYGIPTRYSQRRTVTEDAPAIARWCRQDEVDVVVLVPL